VVVVEARADEVLAATKLQSTFRGHTIRNEAQEASRLQWMNYYMQPAVADWEEALALAVTPEEERRVHDARASLDGEEEKRIKWFKHYLQTRNYPKAAELAVSPTEVAKLLKAKALPDLGPFACCLSDQQEQVESERVAKFVQAIREYEWEVAEILAAGAEEAQDVADSKLRVQLMESAIAEGNYPAAAELAITVEEQKKIDELANQRH